MVVGDDGVSFSFLMIEIMRNENAVAQSPTTHRVVCDSLRAFLGKANRWMDYSPASIIKTTPKLDEKFHGSFEARCFEAFGKYEGLEVTVIFFTSRGNQPVGVVWPVGHFLKGVVHT